MHHSQGIASRLTLRRAKDWNPHGSSKGGSKPPGNSGNKHETTKSHISGRCFVPSLSSKFGTPKRGSWPRI